MLVAARRNAFSGYRDRLAQYAARKAAGADGAELAARRYELTVAPHRTVWLETKRQRSMHADIDALFSDVPEALAW